MDEFKKGDSVFVKRTAKFAEVFDCPNYIETLEEGMIRVSPTISSLNGYFIYPVRELILVSPDTPENRLAIQIKYG